MLKISIRKVMSTTIYKALQLKLQKSPDCINPGFKFKCYMGGVLIPVFITFKWPVLRNTDIFSLIFVELC